MVQVEVCEESEGSETGIGGFFMYTPPMSNEVRLDSGRDLEGSAMGATVDEGWLAFPLDKSAPSDLSGGGFRLGFVIGIANFATVREAIVFSRAR